MCQHPVDMRKGINGLYKLERSEMKMSPLTGSVFIFYGKNHQGFNLKKPTAGFLLGKAAETLENFYKAIRKAVLSDDYIASDETYFKILVPEKNSKGKGVKKGYFWVIVGQKSGLLYVV